MTGMGEPNSDETCSLHGMQDVALDDEGASAPKRSDQVLEKNAAVAQSHANVPSNNNSGDDTASSSHSNPTTSRCGNGCCRSNKNHHQPIPAAITCGRDLGVWDSSLEDRAGIVSSWLLSYLTPLLQLGSHKVLNPEDIGVPSRQDDTENAYQQALSKWHIQSQKAQLVNEKLKAAYERKLAKCTTDEQRAKVPPPQYCEPSIAWALVKAFGVWPLVLGQIYYVISALLTFVPVIILKDLVKFFESELPLSEFQGMAPAWVEVVGLAVIPIVASLLQTRHQAIFAHCAVFVRTAVSALLYRKALKVSAASVTVKGLVSR